jgi:hypothetical protein
MILPATSLEWRLDMTIDLIRSDILTALALDGIDISGGWGSGPVMAALAEIREANARWLVTRDADEDEARNSIDEEISL